jgi:NAD(P)-dependent dehydrogenase (short-subunit alcohol dehydrogenase family)
MPTTLNPINFARIMSKRIAVVTGANKGLGKEIARQLAQDQDFRVIVTGRDLPAVRKAAEEIGSGAMAFRLDITNQESVDLFANFLKENFQQVDVLVNNAGVMGSKPLAEFDVKEIEQVMDTNFMGAVRLTAAVKPLLEKSPDARVINISSIMGSKDYLVSGSAAYRLSKWALNGFVIQMANEFRDTNIKVFAVHPGWVQTEMGGPGAIKTVAEGADTPVWLATSNAYDLETGWFYSDRRKIPY